MKKYDHKKIEKKWQDDWEKNEIYKTSYDTEKKKFYTLVEFPYPSGAGVHVGHAKGHNAVDVFARYKRMSGYNVLIPMGFDAFGLPAENFAIKNKKHPGEFTQENINNFIKQIKKFGCSFDWSRKVDTTDPKYYKWTQWIFLKLFEMGLAYEKEAPINWCPSCKTGLANEEVINGKCERCDSDVEQRNMKQWFLKITDYAEKLIKDLDDVNWPEYIKTSQKNWIGKSEGAEIEFDVSIENVKKTALLVHGIGADGESNFFPFLKEKLKAMGYEVIAPNLPDSKNPNLNNYLDYLNDIKKYIKGDLTIIAHSLGCPTVLKFIQENNIKVNNLILVAPADLNSNKVERFNGWFKDDLIDSLKVFFSSLEIDFNIINNLVNKSSVYLSTNDEFVPLEIQDQYKDLNCKKTILENRGHFLDLEFNEILNDFYNEKIKVFTTRVDTIFGCTYVVLAPENKIIDNLKSSIKNISEVEKYIEVSKNKKDLERTDLNKDKSGVKLEGVYAINPFNNEKVEVWIADYVLGSYGTGAVMAVPAHDERDMEFTKKYNLKIRESIKSEKFTDDGILIDSGYFTNLDSKTAREKMIQFAEENNFGKRKINYKFRDWLFSRQRYWGEPIPVVHCENCGIVPLPESELPLLLPDVENYEPTGTGDSPLASVEEWVNTTCPKCVSKARRETNTMPQWAGSSWYFLRYIDPNNDKALASPDLLKHFMPVDIYFGGAEHTTVHLLYSRFWNKALYDAGVVPVSEPYKRRVQHGLIAGEDGRKMSKRWGNVINPDDVIEQYGADTMRTYIMFMGPYGEGGAWSTTAINGVNRFINRVWSLQEKEIVNEEDDKETLALLHKTIKKVGDDIENVSYHTALSQMMILLNHIYTKEKISKNLFNTYLQLLAPFAPHVTEEIWNNINPDEKSIHISSWPQYSEELMQEDEVNFVFSINGKMRDIVKVKKDISQEEIEKISKSNEKVSKYLEGQNIKKIIFVKNKMINFVI